MVAPGLCDRVASPGEGLSICSCRSAMYHISPTVCKRKFRFCKKMREKRSHFPGKNPAARKKAPASPDGMPVRELRCQLVSVGGAGGSSGGMGS